MRRAREWRTALVSASCAMPMISRSTPSPKRGSSSTSMSIGTVVVRCARSAIRLSAARDRPRRRRRSDEARRPIAAPRPCACAPDRPPSRCLPRDRGGSAARFALRRLQLHQDRARSPAPGCRECRARAGCAPRGSPCGAPRARLLLDQPALMQRQRRLPRDRFGEHDAPPLGPLRSRVRCWWRSLIQPSVRLPITSGATTIAVHAACGGMNRANGLAAAASSPAVLDRRVHPGLYAKRWSASSRAGTASVCEAAASASCRADRPCRRSTASQRCSSSSISQTLQPWLSVSSTMVFVSAAEKAFDVGLAHQQIERELHDLGLHRRQALGAAALVVLAR